MSHYTLEIGGVPIAVYGDTYRDEAESYLLGDVMAEDLLALRNSDGSDLWDGEAPLFVREAFEDEIHPWRKVHESARTEGEMELGDEALLIPVVDVAEDEQPDETAD